MQIYITKSGHQQGPYTADQLAELFQSQTITSEDMYWHEGCENWMPISQFPGYASPEKTKLPPFPSEITPLSSAVGTATPFDSTKIKRYGRNTNIGVGLGFLLAFIAGAVKSQQDSAMLGALMQFIAIVIFNWGCCNYAMKKGYHWAWGLLALLTLPGLIILMLMKNRNKGKR